MRDEVAELVFSVLREGLQLKDRVDRGETVDFQSAQAKLTLLLRRENEARQWPAFGGDGGDFLGARYALACWLDEIFCDHPSDWGRQWINSKRETALYNSNDRAWRFWEQVQMAEARSEKDALEAYYLCVMLGFRGTYAGQPGRLQTWREGMERQMNQGQSQEWAAPPELPAPQPNVPPLAGQGRFRKGITTIVVLLGISLLILAFQLVRSLGQG